ncbi:EAL domain-containing protein [Sporosarcina jiandibaonis]|uniref:EAL domain-containing protein n=1 Tax=Sporosarcina jiandibaonis TaxID=2715535 RepID=UPI0015537738|nr:EAL domain-containing protein [Sporosarcina jiandibaonis]
MSTISSFIDEMFCVSISDRNGKITYVNQMFCDLSMYTKEELLGNTYEMLNPNYKNDIFISGPDYDYSQNKVLYREIKAFTKYGTPYWIHATIVPVLDEVGMIEQFISFDIDITKNILTDGKYKKALKSLQNIEHALDQSSVVAITNPQGVITYANNKFCELSKYSSEELIGQTHRLVNSGYHPKQFFEEMWKTIGSGKIWTGEIKNRAKDGSHYWVNTTIVPFLDENGKPLHYIAIRTDITDKKNTEQSLEIALKNDFQQTVKSLQNMIFKYIDDGNGGFTFTLIEGKAAEKLGISVEKFSLNQIKHSFTDMEIKRYIQLLKKGLEGNAVQFEVSFFQHTFLIYLSPIMENDKVLEVVGTAIDISDRKKAEKLVEHMAYYDYLTELPNRRLFKKKVEEKIKQAQIENNKFALMFIDLDRFKNINGSMGHSIGDKILLDVGERLKKYVRNEDIVGRHGGDEFVVLLPSTGESEAEAVANQIIHGFSEPFYINSIEVYIDPSIGISLFPDDGTTYDQLTSNADSAMFIAKEKRNNTPQFFTEKLAHIIKEKTLLEAEIRQALQKNQFEVYYQPQVNMKTGEIIGLEALLRWHHPTMGNISPSRFIPIAEETGLIIPVGQWVLETACAQMKNWQDKGIADFRISVNVSIHQFHQPSFVEHVKETLEKTGLLSKYLNLEITESMTSDKKNFQETLSKIRNANIDVSIDDFGTGYSSLSYLSKFPITHLKIDQAFIQELSRSNQAIIKTIITLAKNLCLTVIAEGVETQEQASFLEDLHCDEAQGFFYSKPLPREQVEVFLKENK